MISMRRENALYIMRLILGIVFGTLCGIFGLTGLSGLLVGVSGYLLSYYVARIMGFNPLLMKKLRSIYFEGALEYFAAWFLLWTLMYTLLKAPKM